MTFTRPLPTIEAMKKAVLVAGIEFGAVVHSEDGGQSWSGHLAAMRAGARGYILKGARHQELLQAIRAVAGGQALFGPAIAKRMMSFFDAVEDDLKSHYLTTRFQNSRRANWKCWN